MDDRLARKSRRAALGRALRPLLPLPALAMMLVAGARIGLWRAAWACPQLNPPYIRRNGQNVNDKTFYIGWDPTSTTLGQYRKALQIEETGALDVDFRFSWNGSEFVKDGEYADTTGATWKGDGGAVGGSCQLDDICEWDDLATIPPGEGGRRDDPLEGAKVTISIFKMDLQITNGGNNGQEGAAVPDADEDTVGAYLLVNWDDDDQNGAIDDSGTSITLPIPDLSENYVKNEDDLAKIVPSLSPNPGVGTLALKIVSGGSHIRFWDSDTKGNPITKLEWDLATQTPPAELWLEGFSASPERGVELKLEYKDPSNVETYDTLKATVVLINLGVGLYRQNAIPLADPALGHTGLLTAFNGACTRTDLLDAQKYEVTEMQWSILGGGCVTTTWKAFHNAAPYWYEYDSSPDYPSD